MRLESAMFSSRAGLTAHGQALAVIGDNISNSNTVGYKASRPEFIDVMSEGKDGYATATVGGAGSGVAVGRVRPLYTVGGTIEFTGRELDVGIEGTGFFVVGSEESPSYTRAGNFQISEQGNLVTADNLNVLGYEPAGTTLGPIDLVNLELSATATTAVNIVGNLDAARALTTVPENPATFREINEAASFVASFDVIDSLGTTHSMVMPFFKTDAGTWSAQLYVDGAVVGRDEGLPVLVSSAANLNFDASGNITAADAAQLAVNIPYAGGAAAGAFTVDLSGFTQLATVSQVSGITRDGEGVGQVQKYAIDKNGMIRAVLSTGNEIEIARIPLATFNNIDGLERIGNNLVTETLLSGERTIGTPGTLGFGTLSAGALERSTVDLAAQFIDMVLYQRGYQASSQTLSAANELIQQTLNLMR